MIHCSDYESLLVSPKDLDSWKLLLREATIRNHTPLLDLAESTKEGEIPSVSYYRKCSSLLTMKRELAKVSQTTAILVEINENNVVEVTAEEILAEARKRSWL